MKSFQIAMQGLVPVKGEKKAELGRKNFKLQCHSEKVSARPMRNLRKVALGSLPHWAVMI